MTIIEVKDKKTLINKLLDLNAKAFYEHLGFQVYKELDEQGNILYMKCYIMQ